MLKTTDNNCGSLKLSSNHVSNLSIIANKKIGSLISTDNTNLLIFPHDLNQYGDKISDEHVFEIHDSILTTGNIMGFIGVNDSEITIKSRFSKDDNDYFLHYMLQKVFSINLFDLKHGTNQNSIFDFLLYLFPFYLKKALRQGIYKEYNKREYNNSDVRGTINLNRHIRENIPFVGRITYRVREHSYDNRITQLIRHTIEFIRQHKFAHGILYADLETQNCVLQITQATPCYNNNQRISIINKNLKQLHHPYFSEYKDLQKICLQILKYEGIKYGNEKNKIYGLLFDGAWLWEEYLDKLLSKQGFKHPKNKSSEGAIYLFNKSKCKRFPDFWKEGHILDAKYKRIEGREAEKIDRNDMNQIISYIYVLQAIIGGFICPSESEDTGAKLYSLGILNGYGGEVDIWSLSIPRKAENFTAFRNEMNNNEKLLINLIEKQDRKARTSCSE